VLFSSIYNLCALLRHKATFTHSLQKGQKIGYFEQLLVEQVFFFFSFLKLSPCHRKCDWKAIYHFKCCQKSRVKYKSELSEIFCYNNGLMQGKARSPFLFSLYKNDVEAEILFNSCAPDEFKDISLFTNVYR